MYHYVGVGFFSCGSTWVKVGILTPFEGLSWAIKGSNVGELGRIGDVTRGRRQRPAGEATEKAFLEKTNIQGETILGMTEGRNQASASQE